MIFHQSARFIVSFPIQRYIIQRSLNDISKILVYAVTPDQRNWYQNDASQEKEKSKSLDSVSLLPGKKL